MSSQNISQEVLEKRFDSSSKKCSVRSEFSRDRDRIIHSEAFRKLKDKAQVFILAKNDTVRTRLTHTLEVTQIARTIAKKLQLDEDLTEAIGLGHDLGHTPFGHMGERALGKISKDWFKNGKKHEDVSFFDSIQKDDWKNLEQNGFRHNIHSLKVVDFLEKSGVGLNLTYAVRNGILKHSKWGKPLSTTDEKYLPVTREGQIVRLADRIAYVNHDFQDALAIGLLSEKDIDKDIVKILGESYSERIDTAVKNVIQESQGKNIISISEDVAKAIDDFYTFLDDKVYSNPKFKDAEEKITFVITNLANFYDKLKTDNDKEKIEKLLTKKSQNIENLLNEIDSISQEGYRVKIIDYIAGLTDRSIISEFQEHCVPEPWY